MGLNRSPGNKIYWTAACLSILFNVDIPGFNPRETGSLTCSKSNLYLTMLLHAFTFLVPWNFLNFFWLHTILNFEPQRLRNHRSRCINLHQKISYHNDSCYFDIAVNVHLWTLVLGPEHIDPLHWKPSLVLLKTLFSLTLIVWIFKMIKCPVYVHGSVFISTAYKL